MARDPEKNKKSPTVLPKEPNSARQKSSKDASKDIEVIREDALETTVEKGLVQSDPLKIYLDDLKKYPLLSPEQEFQYAIALKEKGDIQAAKILVQANLRLVVKIALEYRSLYTNILDLIQEGNVGLMKAVSRFDPTKGARLGYYSSWWIRSYILKYLIDNFRLVKVGTTQAQKKLFYHLIREQERLEAQGIMAGPKLLADRLHVKEDEVIEMQQRLGHGDLSLDAPMDSSGESTTTHLEGLSDDRESIDVSLEHTQLLEMLEAKLPEFKKVLKEKELLILNERLLNENPRTLQDIASQYGLTRERARQIETKVIEKLKDFLQLDSSLQAEPAHDNSSLKIKRKKETKKNG